MNNIYVFLLENWSAVAFSVLVIYILHWILTSPKKNPAPKVTLEEVVNKPHSFTGQQIPCYQPTTGKLLGYDYSATNSEVQECVERARKAQTKWKSTTFAERKAFLHDLMEAIVANKDQIAHASHLDTGKCRLEQLMGEIIVSCEKIRYTIRHGEEALKPKYRKIPLLFALGGKYARIEYHPLGVIGAIVPWNYPFHNFISPVISALFSGNAIIVKVSECATYSRRFYEEIVQRVLIARGHDPYLVQTLSGYGDVGAALVQSKGVDKILFIGSPQTGARVMKAASDTLKPVILELGGKDPMIIMPPCDLEVSADRAVLGSFFNLGQNCISAERVLVDNRIFDKFVDVLVKKVAKIRQGVDTGESCVDFGCMTVKSQLTKVKELIDDAVSKGAKVLYGGNISKEFSNDSLFFQPTILTNLNKSMRLWTEELFGPVMLLIPFSSTTEAVQIANDTPFGLGCSILSDDLRQAEKVGSQIESGMCNINDYGLYYMMQDMPFGGCKDSGFGRFNGPEGLQEFCRVKSVAGAYFTVPPSMGHPAFLRRPLANFSPALIDQFVTLFYGWGILVKLGALGNILRILITGKK